jgi:hypothetical protein
LRCHRTPDLRFQRYDRPPIYYRRGGHNCARKRE